MDIEKHELELPKAAVSGNCEPQVWHKPTITKIAIQATLNAGSTLTDGNANPGSL
jgi:hypothetical protein